jgi:hypothetical protein
MFYIDYPKITQKNGDTMNIFGLNISIKKKDKRQNHEFTQEDSETGVLKREYNKIQKEKLQLYREKLEMMKEDLEHRRALQQQNHLEELMQEDEEEEDDDEEDMYDENGNLLKDYVMSKIAPEDNALIGLITKILDKTPSNKSSMSPKAKQHLSKEEIKQHIAKISKFEIKQIKKLDVDTLKAKIIEMYPDYDTETINNTVVLLQEI